MLVKEVPYIWLILTGEIIYPYTLIQKIMVDEEVLSKQSRACVLWEHPQP